MFLYSYSIQNLGSLLFLNILHSPSHFFFYPFFCLFSITADLPHFCTSIKHDKVWTGFIHKTDGKLAYMKALWKQPIWVLLQFKNPNSRKPASGAVFIPQAPGRLPKTFDLASDFFNLCFSIHVSIFCSPFRSQHRSSRTNK